MHKDFLFSTSLPRLAICCLFDKSHFDRCEVITHCSFELHFPEWFMMLSIFSCAWKPSACLLWENVYLDPLPIFKSGCLLFFMFPVLHASEFLLSVGLEFSSNFLNFWTVFTQFFFSLSASLSFPAGTEIKHILGFFKLSHCSLMLMLCAFFSSLWHFELLLLLCLKVH